MSAYLDMDDYQRLYPGELYALHRVLSNSEFVQELNERGITVQPSLYSKHSRTFHFGAVAPEIWEYRSEEGISNLKDIINDLRKLASDDDTEKGQYKGWTRFCMGLSSELTHIKQSIHEIERLIKDPDAVISEACSRQIHHCLLTLYEGYHHNRLLNLDGIIFRTLQKTHRDSGSHIGINYLFGELLTDKEGEKRTYLHYPWVKGKFRFNEKVNSIDVFQCQELAVSTDRGQNRFKIFKENLQDIENTPGFRISELLLQKLYISRLDISGLTGSKGNNSSVPVCVIPIYDSNIRIYDSNSQGHDIGQYCATLVLLFENNSLKWFAPKKHFGNPKPSILESLNSVSRQVVRELQDSALSTILSQPIKPPYDLIEHFVSHLRILQDWERIIVFRKDGKVSKSQYCYRWKDEGGIPKWGRCSCNNRKLDCLDCVSWDDASGNTGKYLCWDNDLNLWNRAFIPSINKEEEQSLSPFRIAFEYPTTSIIPKDEIDRKNLGVFYIRQQFELLRGLMRKVRARRSALRNAAVSIMARNMSHNIGSHVIAAVRGDHGADVNSINQLNEHLQRRMDFIAELATVEAVFSADNELFSEVLGSEKCVDGLGKSSGLNAQTLLLRHISGSQTDTGEPVTASVIIVGNPQATVSFRSGLLGWQALYVILENIIRNVAKHGGIKSSEKEIKIYLKAFDKEDDLFEIRIWDECKSANKDVRDKRGVKVVEYLADRMNNPIFLGNDDAISRNDWGMKEIYISAAYLRGYSLADLEGQGTKDQFPVIRVCAMDVSGNVRCEDGNCDRKNGSCANGNKCNGDEIYQNLGFRLWLPKTKTVAIIVDDLDDWQSDLEPKRQLLRQHGVDFYNYETVISGSKEILHRYGAWLSKEEVPEENRAKLPVNLIEAVVGVKNEIKIKLKQSDIEGLITLIHSHVLDNRKKQFGITDDFRVLRPFEESTQQLDCGKDLASLGFLDFTKAVVFDWHGVGVDKKCSQWLQECRAENLERGLKPLTPEEVVDAFAFYESFRTPFPQQGLFPSLSKDVGHLFEDEILCAAITPVLILDERFQRISKRPFSTDYEAAIPYRWRNNADTLKSHFSMGDVWRRMGVYVPSADDCNLERPVKCEILDFLSKIENKLDKGAYIVAHQSIYEKLGDTGSQLSTRLAEKALEHNWINVVCSGRGVPWQLLEYTPGDKYRPRFIALSALLECLEHMPSKIHLIRLLEVTRVPKK